MFSIKEKQFIADSIEKILLALDHPEMPKEKPKFELHVEGKYMFSWADIKPNWMYDENNKHTINPWNEKSREILGGTNENS